MRDYPGSVSNVFPANSSKPSSFDADYALSANEKASINVSKSPFHHSYHQQHPQQPTPYGRLNGDLSNNYRASNNNGTHQTHSNGVGYKKQNGFAPRSSESAKDTPVSAATAPTIVSNLPPVSNNRNASAGPYSLFDAITNAMSTGNCNGTVYPLNDPDEINYLNDDKLFVTASSANPQPIHQTHYDPDLSMPSLKNLTTPLINSTMQQSNGNNSSNNWSHQYPSVNYKNSYLLWIGTPVAAR